MMLGNVQIKHYVDRMQLIQNYEEECLQNCSYKLRIGKIVRPCDGQIFSCDNFSHGDDGWLVRKLRLLSEKLIQKQCHGEFRRIDNSYLLKPNELVIFQTKEKVKMPINLAASYSALDSIAKQGILLINASMVEPGYEGYLSGVLMNFSSRVFEICPQMEIVRINFYEVRGDVKIRHNETQQNYTEELQNKARNNYTQTFLNIEQIQDGVVRKTAQKVKRSFVFGGVMLAFILALCTIEPVLYKYIWHDSWVPLNSTQKELEQALMEAKERQQIELLTKRLDSLQIIMKQQNERISSISSTRGL